MRLARVLDGENLVVARCGDVESSAVELVVIPGAAGLTGPVGPLALLGAAFPWFVTPTTSCTLLETNNWAVSPLSITVEAHGPSKRFELVLASDSVWTTSPKRLMIWSEPGPIVSDVPSVVGTLPRR